MSLGYRREIDGLRAIAVLSVVLYHAGFPLISGGYVGVDVFFVISGYLITGIIVSDLLDGSFSLLGFYEKRARRILPALIFVLLVVSVFAWVVLTPAALKDYGDSVSATMLFGANVYFWQTLGYFTTAADFRLLLHTWSLAVEEQFYVLWPFILMLCVRLDRRTLLPATLVILTVSLLLCVLFTEGYRRESFYLAPFRAWELLAGASVYFITSRWQARGFVRALGSHLGLALVLGAIFFFDASTVFPGYAAVAPVLGSALLILCRPEGALGRFLCSRFMVFFGLISYSLYLWHWPILASMRVINGAVDLPPLVAAAAVTLSVLLAWLSWRFVESPFRDRRRLTSRRIWQLSAGAITVVLTAGVSLSVNNGVPGRLNAAQKAYAGVGREQANPFIACSNRFPSEQGLCGLGRQAVAPEVLLWGDSHAASIAPALAQVLESRGMGGVLASHDACAPLLGVIRVSGGQKGCPRFNRDVAAYSATQPGIQTVILAGRWPLNATGERAPGEPGNAVVLALQGQGGGADSTGSAPGNAAVMRSGLTRTITALLDQGKRVIILGGVPEIGWNVPSALFASSRLRIAPPAAPTRDTAERRHALSSSVGRQLAAELEVEWLPLLPVFCRPDCVIAVDGMPAYVDDDHLSAVGSLALMQEPLARLMQARSRMGVQVSAKGVGSAQR